jgi:hypothetical protein
MDLGMKKIVINKFFSVLNPCSFLMNQISFLFLVLIFISCSSSVTSLYDSNFPLTNEIAKSKTTQLSVKIPQGWFTADDNEYNYIDLWLIKDDYSATLNFVFLNLDSETKKEISSNEMSSVVSFSKTFKKAKYGSALKEFLNEETFQLNGKTFSSYEYLDDQKRNIRVIVFKSGENFYELSAIPIKNQNPGELFKIQNSVLSSIN